MKKILRKKYIDIRKNIDLLEKSQADLAIFEKLKAHSRVAESSRIMVYISTADEVDTYRFIKYLLSEEKNVYVPVLVNNDISVSGLVDIDNLLPGKFNIPEPAPEYRVHVDPAILEVIIVPGVCFTSEGARLGRGGGYYDRFLAGISGSAVKIGICYSFQMVNEIPCNAGDAKVDEIITEKE